MKVLKTFRGSHTKGSSIFSLMATSKYLFSGSRDHGIQVFNIQTLDNPSLLDPPHYDGINAFCLLEGENKLVSARFLIKTKISPFISF